MIGESVSVRHQPLTVSRQALAYIEVTKPLPSALLAFIGVCTAFIASEGAVSFHLLLVLAAVLVASAGANGLTNYLDRNLDSRMKRTCDRALPAGRISSPQKVLPFLAVLIGGGLALAWFCIRTLSWRTWRALPPLQCGASGTRASFRRDL